LNPVGLARDKAQLFMKAPDDNMPRHFESVHFYAKCGHSLNLEMIDLMAITTGIIECPNCDFSGPIEIRVVDVNAHE